MLGQQIKHLVKGLSEVQSGVYGPGYLVKAFNLIRLWAMGFGGHGENPL